MIRSELVQRAQQWSKVLREWHQIDWEDGVSVRMTYPEVLELASLLDECVRRAEIDAGEIEKLRSAGREPQSPMTLREAFDAGAIAAMEGLVDLIKTPGAWTFELDTNRLDLASLKGRP